MCTITDGADNEHAKLSCALPDQYQLSCALPNIYVGTELILEQGACPLRLKGARSKTNDKKGARSMKTVILEPGAEIC